MNQAPQMPSEIPSPNSLKGRITPVNFESRISASQTTPPPAPKKKPKKIKNKKKKNRCCFEGCRKKLTLTQQTMKCRCNMCFCSKHFPSEEHHCTFDYKAFSKENFENAAGLGGGQFSKLESI
jgi:hypothetical protein